MCPARIVSPHSVLARPLLEPRVEALYDSDVWSSTTRRIDFFQIPLGEAGISGDPNIPGTRFLKALRHSNNERGGSLNHPRMFVVKGLRIMLNDAPQSTSKEAKASTSFTLTARSFQNLLLTYLQYATYFQFLVGSQKVYAEGPAFAFPGNIGIQARVSNVCAGQRLNAAQPPVGVISEGYHAHGAGLYHSLGRNTVTIGPGQSFRGVLAAGIEPQLSIWGFFGALIDPQWQIDYLNRLVYCYLDGWLGAEVQ